MRARLISTAAALALALGLFLGNGAVSAADRELDRLLCSEAGGTWEEGEDWWNCTLDGGGIIGCDGDGCYDCSPGDPCGNGEESQENGGPTKVVIVQPLPIPPGGGAPEPGRPTIQQPTEPPLRAPELASAPDKPAEVKPPTVRPQGTSRPPAPKPGVTNTTGPR